MKLPKTAEGKIKLAAELLQAAQEQGQPQPLSELLNHLFAEQPQPEGMSEKDHCWEEFQRARDLSLHLFDEYCRIGKLAQKRWDAWENAPGGLMEKLSSLDDYKKTHGGVGL